MPIGDKLVKQNFLKSEQLKGDGKILRLLSEPELVDSAKYGFTKGPHVGKTLRYSFETLENGVVTKVSRDTTSSRFLQALNSSGAEVGDFVRLSVIGTGLDTTYIAVKVTKPDNWPS